jgi:hypothetical protein
MNTGGLASCKAKEGLREGVEERDKVSSKSRRRGY